MVEIITAQNRHMYGDLLEDMFRQRYRVLVEGMRWKIPNTHSGRDIDQFDSEHTVYLVIRHPDTHELVGSSRLNPTTQPHLMSDIFLHQCDLSGVPVGEDIWELSRVVYDPSLMNKTVLAKVRASMRLAIVEFCMANEITALSWLTRRSLFASLCSFWPSRPLGGTVYYADDDEYYIAALSQIDIEAYQKSHAAYESVSDTDLVLTHQIPTDSWDVPPIIALERQA